MKNKNKFTRSNSKENNLNLVERRFAMANDYHEKGDFEKAKEIYTNILQEYPSLSMVWDRLGHVYMQQCDYTNSIKSFLNAYKINPDSLTTNFNLALSYKECGEWERAIEFSNKALEIDEQDNDVLSLSGEIFYKTNQLEKAESVFRKSVKIHPNNIKNYIDWCLTLNALGFYSKSIEVCNIALKFAPQSGQLFFIKATTYKTMSAFDEAINAYEKAILLMPEYSPSYNNLANIYLSMNQPKLAIEFYEKSLQLNPNDPDVLGNMADAFFKERIFNKCINLYKKSISIDGGTTKKYINFGNALQMQHCWNEAIECYDKAIEIDAHNPEVWCNKGNAYKGMKQWDLARECYVKAQNLDKNFAQAYWNQSLLELTIGNFDLGFKLYEWRWKNPELGLINKKIDYPLWLGQDNIKGKHLFVWEEQGFGDKIQMMRYAKFLTEEHGVHVSLEVPSALYEIAKSISPSVNIVLSGELPEFIDYHCPYMSLPLASGTVIENIPTYSSYLFASEIKRSKWNSLIDNIDSSGKSRIGIAWSGSTGHTNDHMRSISLESMLNYSHNKNATYWSLQKEYRSSDLGNITLKNSSVYDMHDELYDFSDTAALISHMDKVICVDTSVAHLAAAMGKPVTLLLPDDPDFRWLSDINYSPWYPSITIKYMSEYEH